MAVKTRHGLKFYLFLLATLGAAAFIILNFAKIKNRVLIFIENKPYVAPSTSPTSESKFNVLLGYNQPGKRALLPGAKWVPQTFNNCVPATASMVLQYFGFSVGQEQTKADLRTNPTDSNVFTYELSDYLKAKYGIESKLLYNGDVNTVKTLLANGFYVVVEDWLHPNEDIGHITIIRGFDDEKGVFIADDSYIGVNITYKYDTFLNTQWKAFNWEYLPVYKKGQESLLRAIVGENWDETKMYQNAIKRNQKLLENDPNDFYLWFNLGTSYYALGDYQKAKEAFEKSKSYGWPRRMLWYQYQPVQTYNKLGEYQKALDLAALGLASNDSYAELHLENAIAYRGLGNLDKAREEAEKALNFAPNYKAAQDFLDSL